jgi:HK97 family phage major capsid protein
VKGFNVKHDRNMALAAAACSALIVPSSLPRALSGRGQHGMGLVIKADANDPQTLFAGLQTAVAALRSEVEAGLQNRVTDVVLDQKIGTINDAVGNLQTALEAIQAQVQAGIKPVDGVIGDLPANPDYVRAFKAFMRRGDDSHTRVNPEDSNSPFISNAMSIGSNPDGGYTAPVEWDRSITQAMTQYSPIRENAEVITISGPGFTRLFATGAPGSGWVGETAGRPQTSTPQFVPLAFGLGEIYAMPAITQQALDDSAIDLEAWLAGQVREEFARQENIAFLSGDGTNKPYGLLNYVEGGTFEARHPLGAIGVTDAGAALEGDDFIKIIYDLPAERVTSNTKFFINRTTLGQIRTWKDANGNYIWQPSFTAGQPQTIGGVGTVEIPGMPLDGAGNVVALYGDMRQTYLVIDRVGIRVLRDPYTNKPYVMFYTTKRVGGGVQNPEYMRALRRAA